MTTTDKIIELFSLALLLYLVYIVVNSYPNLPDVIPTHFGLDGKPDDWGCKSTIILLPSIAGFIYLLLSGVSLLPPTLFNYPVNIDDDNRDRQYLLALKLLRTMKLTVISLFFYITYSVINISDSSVQSLGVWFLPCFIIVIFLTIIIYLRVAIKNK